MSAESGAKAHSLEEQGISGYRKVYWDLSLSALTEEAVKRGEAQLAAHGPLVALTGKYTGRSPNDKFIVKEPSCDGKVWWGKVNRPIDPAQFEKIYKRFI